MRLEILNLRVFPDASPPIRKQFLHVKAYADYDELMKGILLHPLAHY